MIEKKRKGFTLVEVIITIAILALVFGMIFPFLNSNINTLNKVEKSQDLQNKGKKALDKMTKEVLECSKVDSVTLQGGVSGNDKNSIQKVEAIVFKAGTNYKKFQLTAEHKLFYGSGATNGIAAAEEIAQNITSMKLTPTKGTFLQSNGVIVQLVLEREAPGTAEKTITSTVETQIYFRNVE